MEKPIYAINGMKDYLPTQTKLWYYIKDKLIAIITSYGYIEVRSPIIEQAFLFKKAIGSSTDIINKELYIFTDKKGKDFTLKPEGTAGCVRAGIEHGFIHNQPQRVWYFDSMFRHDRPQKGRYRQFNQLGIESFGQKGPEIDAELIILTKKLWTTLGINRLLSLEVNSIGSIEEREAYNKTLAIFFNKNIKTLDKESINKLPKNPISILDSKEKAIKKLVKKAPIIYDYLTVVSKRHLNKLCKHLDLNGINYKLNNYLVRGLDYYNSTVFEWIESSNIKAQNTVCGGGRYDNLVEKLGGLPTPAIGCALGLERIIIILINKTEKDNKPSQDLDIYVIPKSKEEKEKAMIISETIRNKLTKLRVLTSYEENSIKRKLIKAYKHKPKIAIIIGSGKYKEDNIIIKSLINGTQAITSKETIINTLKKIL